MRYDDGVTMFTDKLKQHLGDNQPTDEQLQALGCEDRVIVLTVEYQYWDEDPVTGKQLGNGLVEQIDQELAVLHGEPGFNTARVNLISDLLRQRVQETLGPELFKHVQAVTMHQPTVKPELRVSVKGLTNAVHVYNKLAGTPEHLVDALQFDLYRVNKLRNMMKQ